MIELKPVNGALGIEICGVDLSQQLDPGTMAEIRQAFLDHIVIVFRDQDLSPAAHVAFTEYFGAAMEHPLATRRTADGYPAVLILENRPGKRGAPNDYWHSDISHMEEPPMASILHAKEIPEGRGDTMFCNMYAALDGVSDTLKEVLGGLRALHSGAATFRRADAGGTDALKIDQSKMKPPESHPVLRTHPDTGRKALFVNPHFTLRFDGMSDDESRALLEHLYAVATKPENVYRHHWRVGDVVMWDNRAAMHYAVRDYTEDMPRLLHRTTAAGDRPV